jgi:PAS domain S-box-containing protein
MRAQNKTQGQLINEFNKPGHRIIEESQLEGRRKQTEDVLRESQNYYRTLIQNLPPKIFLKDVNSVYLSCNENFSRDLKMRPAEITGKTDYDFYPKKLAERYRANDKKIMESGKTEDIEEKYIQDGMEMIIHKIKTPVKDEEGKVIGILGIFWDITERKHADEELKKYRERLEQLVEERTAELRNANEQLRREITERKGAEEALRETEEKYRLVVENAGDAILIAQDGMIQFVNPRALEILGYSYDEFISRPFVEFIHPEDRMTVLEFHLKRIKGEWVPEVYSFRVVDKDQNIRWVEINAVLITWHGKPATLNFLREITERKQAEERYRTILRTTMDGFWIVDMEGHFLDVNDAYCRLIGYNRDELLTMRIPDVEAVESPEETTHRIQKIMEVGGDRFETRHRCKDGSTIDVEVSVNHMEDDGRQMFVFLRDITRRKQAEEALRLANAYNRSLIEASLDPLVTIGPDGKITDVNAATEKITGHSSKELIGTDFMNYFSEPGKAEAGCQQVFQYGFVQDYALEIRHKDGHLTPVLYNASVYRDEAGQVMGVFAAARDITERKRAEETLRESEEKYRSILENIQDGYFEVDLAGNCTFANDARCQNLGYTKEELIGMNNRQFEDEENAKKVYQGFNRVYRTGEPVKNIEEEVIRKDGTKAFSELSVSLIRDPEGKPIGFRGISRDATERKRAEEEKVALVDQLRQSQKMEAIGRLAGGVAHDFNNLLTVIKGYCQLSLAEMKESTPIRDALEVINKATEKAADLTRQLLAFSRRQIMEVRVLDLNALLQNLDKMLRRIIGEDIELVTLLGEDLGRVKADPGQIEQVVMNLAVNAKDAMSKGGKLIIETANAELDEAYAHAHVAVTPGRYVMIAVSDTGTGMTPEVRDRVFEPFFTTKGKGKGTGLGLSTVYGIVKQSNGNIWVYSEPGKGTAFKIFLPRVDEPAEKLKGQETGEELPRGSETVLVVEDDKEVRNLAVRILKRQGYTVLDGSYGDQAFNVCRQHKGPIHLLLTDVVMPGMDGRAISESLSQLHPEMKVLYMSGYTGDAIVRHGILIEGINYIQKPFTVEELVRKVREVIVVKE